MNIYQIKFKWSSEQQIENYIPEMISFPLAPEFGMPNSPSPWEEPFPLTMYTYEKIM